MPILIQDIVGPISRALKQAFQTDAKVIEAKFIDALMEVRTGLQHDLEATVPVTAVPSAEDAQEAGHHPNQLTPHAVDEALRK